MASRCRCSYGSATAARPFQKDMQPPPIGSFRNVVINNIVATDVGRIGCSITGQPGHPIENVLLSNLTFTFEGGGDRERTAMEVPELPKKYPECTMFGELPAYGFYARHVNGLRFANVRLRTSKPDLRHAMVLDDVEDLAIDGLDAGFSGRGRAGAESGPSTRGDHPWLPAARQGWHFPQTGWRCHAQSDPHRQRPR